MRADVHMDMVGGDLFKNKSVLHVTQTPWSLPTFVTDIGAAFAEAIRDAATAYTEDGGHEEAAVLENRNGAPGTRNAFFVDETPYAEGSDHDDYDSSTIAVPSLYLRDWPDIYIHTDHDTLPQIDPTKLRRVALLGAASGYSYATLDASQLPLVLPFFTARAQQRLAKGFKRALALAQRPELAPQERCSRPATSWRNCSSASRPPCSPLPCSPTANAKRSLRSRGAQKPGRDVERLADRSRGARRLHDAAGVPAWHATPAAARVPHRIGEFGPLTFQNDDVLRDRLGEERLQRVQLLQRRLEPLRQCPGQKRSLCL